MIHDQTALRAWIVTHAESFAPIAAQTENTVDDKIVDWIRKIALNDRAFASIYHLLQLGLELAPIGDEPIFGAISENVCDIMNEFEDNEDAQPADILTILAAIGLLIQVIRLLRERTARF